MTFRPPIKGVPPPLIMVLYRPHQFSVNRVNYNRDARRGFADGVVEKGGKARKR